MGRYTTYDLPSYSSVALTTLTLSYNQSPEPLVAQTESPDSLPLPSQPWPPLSASRTWTRLFSEVSETLNFARQCAQHTFHRRLPTLGTQRQVSQRATPSQPQARATPSTPESCPSQLQAGGAGAGCSPCLPGLNHPTCLLHSPCARPEAGQSFVLPLLATTKRY